MSTRANPKPCEASAAAPKLLSWLQDHREEMLEAALELARLESPSGEAPSLNIVADHLADRFREVGATVEYENGEASHPPHLVVTWPPNDIDRVRHLLVLGHFDTVWPVGTLATMPVRVEGDHAYGPGLFDMKASLVLFEYALRALVALELTPIRRIVGLLTSDEETGSHTSRRVIERLARTARGTVVLEPPLNDGRLKTARKGIGDYRLTVTGQAAHAGVEPEKGASAIVELAHQILAIENLADPERGTTVTVGVVQGGTSRNIIPPRAEAQIDVRVTYRDEADRVDSAIRSLQPRNPRVRLDVDGGPNRPPMERAQAVGLFEHAREIGRHLGLDLGEGSTGGGSDGNFTAALGVPTLDGLGCPGDGAHAAYEHIVISKMPERAALLALMLLTTE